MGPYCLYDFGQKMISVQNAVVIGVHQLIMRASEGMILANRSKDFKIIRIVGVVGGVTAQCL
jgi:hypothetical protein